MVSDTSPSDTMNVDESSAADALPPPPPRPTTANWDVEALISADNNFQATMRVKASTPAEELALIIEKHEHSGIPLVIEGWHEVLQWDRKLLSADWLAQRHREPQAIRDVYSQEDTTLCISELLSKYRESSAYAAIDEPVRLYGKDLPFPEEWYTQIEGLPEGTRPFTRGDAFQYMRKEDRPETIMTYLGIGDTYTTAHKDSSASTGYNLMLETSSCVDFGHAPDQPNTLLSPSQINPASAYWFMTAADQSEIASEYFVKTLRQALDLEAHYADLEELDNAPFNVFVCEQKLGDLVLIPRMSCHQVVNHGGISLKAAWSRMPLRSVEAALIHELPIYHRVGRAEIYRVKLLIEQSVAHLASKFKDLNETEKHFFPRLLRYLTEIQIEEYHSAHAEHLANDQDMKIHCDCCSADIYQAYFECTKCLSKTGDTYIMCPTCYVEGRSCQCRIMEPHISRPWDVLLGIRNNAALLLEKPPLRLIDYEQTSHPAIFKAGIILLEARKNNTSFIPGKKLHRCSPLAGRKSRPDSEPHTTEIPALVPCALCHRSLCFRHVSQYLHSAQILLLSVGPGWDERWHAAHSARSPQKVFDEAEKPGSQVRNNLEFRLIRAVRMYEICRPADVERTILGWYDQDYVTEDSIPRPRKLKADSLFGKDTLPLGKRASSIFTESGTRKRIKLEGSLSPDARMRSTQKSAPSLEPRKSKLSDETSPAGRMPPPEHTIDSLVAWVPSPPIKFLPNGLLQCLSDPGSSLKPAGGQESDRPLSKDPHVSDVEVDELAISPDPPATAQKLALKKKKLSKALAQGPIIPSASLVASQSRTEGGRHLATESTLPTSIHERAMWGARIDNILQMEKEHRVQSRQDVEDVRLASKERELEQASKHATALAELESRHAEERKRYAEGLAAEREESRIYAEDYKSAMERRVSDNEEKYVATVAERDAKLVEECAKHEEYRARAHQDAQELQAAHDVALGERDARERELMLEIGALKNQLNDIIVSHQPNLQHSVEL